jgi:hypothetical protein
MPKFNLYPIPLPDQPDGADTRVEIGWGPSPTGSVQIATTKLQPGADRQREWMDGPDSRPAWDGQHIGLDRDQINTLIRTLRRARDTAYGRDE